MFHCSHNLFAHLIKVLGLNYKSNLNLKLKHEETEKIKKIKIICVFSKKLSKCSKYAKLKKNLLEVGSIAVTNMPIVLTMH